MTAYDPWNCLAGPCQRRSASPGHSPAISIEVAQAGYALLCDEDIDDLRHGFFDAERREHAKVCVNVVISPPLRPTLGITNF